VARVHDVVGVPRLPPAPATAFVNRLRTAVSRAHRALAPPPVRVVESMLGILDHTALVALCELDVPDRLDRRTTVADLARTVGAEPAPLARLLRYASSRGWVRLDRRGRVSPTRALRFLRRDHAGGWRAWVEFVGGDDVVRALGRVDGAVRTGEDPFASANGAAFFDWFAVHAERQRAFDGAMAAGARMHGLVLAASVDWSAARRVCDVGGGTGALLTTLLDVHPHLDGVLFDLPHVVARADRHDRLHAVGGDAFTSVPAGCDTYLLVNVLHDWSDDDATRLLQRVAAAAPSGARVLVVEHERTRVPLDDIGTRSDLLMLALTPGGRERTSSEFAALAAAAGLRWDRAIPLASGDRAHVLGRA
jgi:O-methyltransferase